MDTPDTTPPLRAGATKSPPPQVTVLMPAVAADAEAKTLARGVYLATVSVTEIPNGAAIIGVAAGPSADGNIALIDPATGVLAWVPAIDVAQYPDHAHAVAGIHIPA